MSYNDFQKESKITLSKSGMVIYFYKINEYSWFIEVNLPGTPFLHESYVGTNWEPATCSTTSSQAYAIYENLIKENDD